ncbi:M1 family metallopeptidase [Mucilaginibacter sp. PAMB04274]|uniref:M1 family metallopeptidase n=1 Tax=Mucilaginibacter sp. PAMB04274 TaxID=3138568 RepID=UPI0031F689F1
MNTSIKIFLLTLTSAFISLTASAQLLQKKPAYTRADTLRGMLTPLRTCYDINYYHLDVKFDIDQQYISGSTQFKFTSTQAFTKLQFDLYANLKVDKIIYGTQELPFTREENAVFVTFPKPVAKGSKDEFTVYYSGKPTVAKRAPWDGGVVFTRDSTGKPWVATACQGAGASIWWPTKDHQSDEVDSMLISVSVPKGLKDVSNGRLRKTTELPGSYTRFDWFVANPINNYDVTANIGDYTHFDDVYNGEKGKLTLDYWVLPYHLELAKKQFGRDVKPMLKAFENWFGPYPWYEDGYKLVETPHLGMEHQSAVAYGNKFRNGYLGRDLSGTGRGLTWDFIIVHESGHEWFGNNITSKDIADMWIHESFTNYSESLFIETYYGKQAGLEYIEGLRKIIQNDEPVIGPYNVNKEGSGDMYPKGANLLGTVRAIISDDAKWRNILRGLNKTFYHQTVTTEQIVNYISQQAGQNFTPIFDQYLRYTNIPELNLKYENNKVYAKWTADVKGFTMPVKLRKKGGEYYLVKLNTEYAPVNMPGLTQDNLEVDTHEFYIRMK